MPATRGAAHVESPSASEDPGPAGRRGATGGSSTSTSTSTSTSGTGGGGGAPNQNLAWAVFRIAPYLHDGAVAPMWIRMADLRIYEGECLNGVN